MTEDNAPARELLAAVEKIGEWIGFSTGAIKDGRGWDAGAEQLRDETRAALKVLGAAAIQGGAHAD